MENIVKIEPTQPDFTPGFQVEGHSRMGKEFDNEVSSCQDLKNAAAAFSFRLTLTNAEAGPQALEVLNSLKDMAGMIPPIAAALEKGVQLNFKHEGTHVYICLVAPTDIPELQMIPGFSESPLEGVDYSGKGDLTATWGVDPVKLLSGSLEDFIEMLSNFKFHAEGHFENMPKVIEAGVKFFHTHIEPLVPKRVKTLVTGVAPVISGLVKNHFGLTYDAQVARSVFKNVAEASGSIDQIRETIKQNQEMIGTYVEQAQQMAPMFLGPYMDLLKSINWGNFQFTIAVAKLRLLIRPGFTLFGLDGFLREKFLN